MIRRFLNYLKTRKERKAKIKLEYERVQAHVELNNLYLRVERGDIKMSITISNKLQTLIAFIYPRSEEKWGISLSDHWMEECAKLPGW